MRCELSKSGVRSAKAAKRIEVLYEAETAGGPRISVLNGVPISPRFDAPFAKLLWPLITGNDYCVDLNLASRGWQQCWAYGQ